MLPGDFPSGELSSDIPSSSLTPREGNDTHHPSILGNLKNYFFGFKASAGRELGSFMNSLMGTQDEQETGSKRNKPSSLTPNYPTNSIKKRKANDGTPSQSHARKRNSHYDQEGQDAVQLASESMIHGLLDGADSSWVPAPADSLLNRQRAFHRANPARTRNTYRASRVKIPNTTGNGNGNGNADVSSVVISPDNVSSTIKSPSRRGHSNQQQHDRSHYASQKSLYNQKNFSTPELSERDTVSQTWLAYDDNQRTLDAQRIADLRAKVEHLEDELKRERSRRVHFTPPRRRESKEKMRQNLHSLTAASTQHDQSSTLAALPSSDATNAASSSIPPPPPPPPPLPSSSTGSKPTKHPIVQVNGSSSSIESSTSTSNKNHEYRPSLKLPPHTPSMNQIFTEMKSVKLKRVNSNEKKDQETSQRSFNASSLLKPVTHRNTVTRNGNSSITSLDATDRSMDTSTSNMLPKDLLSENSKTSAPHVPKKRESEQVNNSNISNKRPATETASTRTGTGTNATASSSHSSASINTDTDTNTNGPASRWSTSDASTKATHSSKNTANAATTPSKKKSFIKTLSPNALISPKPNLNDVSYSFNGSPGSDTSTKPSTITGPFENADKPNKSGSISKKRSLETRENEETAESNTDVSKKHISIYGTALGSPDQDPLSDSLRRKIASPGKRVFMGWAAAKAAAERDGHNSVQPDQQIVAVFDQSQSQHPIKEEEDDDILDISSSFTAVESAENIPKSQPESNGSNDKSILGTILPGRGKKSNKGDGNSEPVVTTKSKSRSSPFKSAKNRKNSGAGSRLPRRNTNKQNSNMSKENQSISQPVSKAAKRQKQQDQQTTAKSAQRSSPQKSIPFARADTNLLSPEVIKSTGTRSNDSSTIVGYSTNGAPGLGKKAWTRNTNGDNNADPNLLPPSNSSSWTLVDPSA